MITGHTFVGIVLAAGGFFFLSVLLTGLWLGVSSGRWPTTEGQILESRVELDLKSTSSIPSYRPRVRYRYRVNGKEYTSEKLTYKGYSTVQEVVQEMVRPYRIGSSVQVHYHPRHPARAVLEPGTTRKYLIPILLAAGLMAAGITALMGITGPLGD